MEKKYFKVSAKKVACLLGKQPRGTKIAKEERILAIVGRAGDHKRWSREVTQDYEWILTENQAEELANFFKQDGTWRPFINGLHPDKRFKTGTLFEPDKNRAEIYWEQLSTRNLFEDEPDPVSKRIAAFVDDVKFRQRDKDGDVSIRDGHYIRIEPTAKHSDGAITLVMDADKKNPRVLLISQYRHNAKGYLVEACRGFGNQEDKNEEETGSRERDEETPFETKDVLSKERLGFIHTDSGKLTERPGYFLEFVDARKKSEEFNRKKPALEDPVWVPIQGFYRAIISQRPIQLKRNEYTFALEKKWRDELNTRAEINGGTLIINDSFTIVAAFLALPFVTAYYRISMDELLQ